MIPRPAAQKLVASVVRRGGRLFGVAETVGLVVDHDEPVAVAGRNPQYDVDRAGQVAAQALSAEQRLFEAVGVRDEWVGCWQVTAQQRREVGHAYVGRDGQIASGQRNLERQLAEPVAQPEGTEGQSGRQRSERRGVQGQ